MENTLLIENFGPLKYNKIKIKDITLVLGSQASGKSTFAKLVYFFLSIKSQITDTLLIILNSPTEIKDFFIMLQKVLRTELYGYFGNFLIREKFEVRYYYSDELYVHLYNNKNGYEIIFSAKLRTKLQNLKTDIEQYKKDNETDVLNASNINTIKEKRNILLGKLRKELNNILNNELDRNIYIPASRSYVNKYKDFQFIKPIDNQLRRIDLLDQEFSDYVSFIKKYFNLSLKEQTELYKNNNILDNDYNIKFPKEAQNLILKILKGEYFSSNNNEQIIFKDSDGEHKVDVDFSSSGQQEALWILNILYRQILEIENFYTVIEEPEAHLYPDAQNNIAKLIALAANKGIKLLVTTHSPYFLGCLSTLFYAKTVENKIKQKLPYNIVSSLQCLDINNASIYYIKNGKLINAYDKKADYITVELIDKASDDNNNRLVKLIKIEG